MAGHGQGTIIKAVLRDTQDMGNPLRFDYIPAEFSEEVEALWEETPIIGRSAPHIGYAGTGARSIGFELKLAAESDAKKEVFDVAMWIQSLKYPDYIGTLMTPPHTVRFTVGSFINIEGIIESASITWQAPYAIPSYYPMLATVSVTIKEIVAEPYGYLGVRNAKSIGVWYRGKDDAIS